MKFLYCHQRQWFSQHFDYFQGSKTNTLHFLRKWRVLFFWVLLQKQTIGLCKNKLKITVTTKTENTHKKDKPCVRFNKIVDNPHFWILYSTFFHMRHNFHILLQYTVNHCCNLLVPTNGENKTAFHNINKRDLRIGFFVRIESRIESAVYHASRNTA